MGNSKLHTLSAACLRLRSGLTALPLGILVTLIGVTSAAWALTLYQAVSMSAPMGVAMRGGMAAEGMAGMAMDGMSAADWSLESLAVFVTLWTVMMVAMMLPAAMPMILVFASAQARRAPLIGVPTWIFIAGYFIIWAVAGLLIYVGAQAGTEIVSRFVSLDRGVWAPLALGATLMMAGLYQFTPLKRVCLRHCRSPLAFVAQHWREGRAGALKMGMYHGLYCLGCCWALFAVLVAAGMMSIAWMLLLTLAIFAEKVLPHGARTSAGVGFGFIVLGLLVASAALQLPSIA
jgi:predicted metal-binding membrane protein